MPRKRKTRGKKIEIITEDKFHHVPVSRMTDEEYKKYKESIQKENVQQKKEHTTIPQDDIEMDTKNFIQVKNHYGLEIYKNKEDIKIEPIESFDDLELNHDILKGIYCYGYENPTPIQKFAIAPIIQGVSVLVQSQSGTGKTATYCIGILDRIDPMIDNVQALILLHTRQLAKQVYEVMVTLNNHIKYPVTLVIGGTDTKENREEIKEKHPKIIIGTLGRMKQLIDEGTISLKDIKIFVIDEVDFILNDKNHSFEEVRKIYYNIDELTQGNAQICIFSATYTNKLANDVFIHGISTTQPSAIFRLPEHSVMVHNIVQYYIKVEQKHKFRNLKDIYSKLRANQTIIFMNDKKTAIQIHRKLINNKFTALLIHGDMSQRERNQVVEDFRIGKTNARILISTDMLSRGIDIQHVSIVINYDIPHDPATYIHRIGRCGRFGRKGIAISFLRPNEGHILKHIEDTYHIRIYALPDNFIDSLYT